MAFLSMKGWDPEGLTGPKKPLPDNVTILEPPIDKIVAEPTSDHRDAPTAIPPAQTEQDAYQTEQPQSQFEQQPEEYQGQSQF